MHWNNKMKAENNSKYPTEAPGVVPLQVQNVSIHTLWTDIEDTDSAQPAFVVQKRRASRVYEEDIVNAPYERVMLMAEHHNVRSVIGP
jgi:hypothetical protein